MLQGEHPRTPDFECYDGTIGSLRELDLTDISVPLAELGVTLYAAPMPPARCTLAALKRSSVASFVISDTAPVHPHIAVTAVLILSLRGQRVPLSVSK